MSEFKHWRVFNLYAHPEIRDEQDQLIAVVQRPAHTSMLLAAPRMLKALQGVVAAWERLYPHMPVASMFEDCEFQEMGAARAAIAAATGAQR